MSSYTICDIFLSNIHKEPFLCGKTLLSKLDKDNGSEVQKEHIDLPLKKYKDIVIKACEDKKDIVALDDNSYLNLLNIKKDVDNTNLCKIEHINKILYSDKTINQITNNLKHKFDGFNANVFMGNYIERDLFENKQIDRLFNSIKLNRVNINFVYYPSGYELYENSKKLAMQIAGKILFDAYDNGLDFLIVSDVRNFTFFDKHQKEISKIFGRDICLPILTLPQVILISLGDTNKKILGFDKHFIKPTFL